MRKKPPVRYAISNHQNLPVELHLASGVIVLPAHGVTDVPESDLATPQLLTLQRHRFISTRRLDTAPAAAAPARPRVAGATPVKQRTAKAAPKKGARGRRRRKWHSTSD